MCSACCEDGRLTAGVWLDGCASDVQHRAWLGVAISRELDGWKEAANPLSLLCRKQPLCRQPG